MDISCRNTKQSVGNIITQGNFLTLKYVTDGWGLESHGFKLVITAIKNISKCECAGDFMLNLLCCNSIFFLFCFVLADHQCKELRCLSSEFCISMDLMCDNVNHCADGTDESSHLCCTYLYICIKNAHDMKMKNYVETSFSLPYQMLRRRQFWDWN